MAEEEPGEGEDPRKSIQQVGGRDELNLAEFPISLLSDRVPSGVKTLVFEDQVFDQQAGEIVKRKLTITGSDAYGLPTATDDEILVALIQLTKLANGFTDRLVHFTRYEILKLLGWSDEGRNYARIEESLNRWMGVTLYYDKAWWNKEAKNWVSEKFHFLETVSLLDRDDRRRLRAKKQQKFAFSSFRWNETIFQSFRAENLKRLNVEVYFSLKSAISKRVYRFLDKRFYHRNRWEFDLREFALEHIGLSRSYSDNGKIKEKLQPAIDELTEIGFLTPMSREERYTKVGRSRWKITLVQKGPVFAAESSQISAPSDLETALIGRGVTPTTAAELVRAYPADLIVTQLEAFDWLRTTKDKRASKSPGGYLTDSIRKNYTAPKGFESKADQAKRLEAERGRIRRAEETKARAEAAERAREEAEQARIKTFWDALSEPDRESLRAEALAQANPFYAQQYRRSQKDPASAERYLKLIIGIHIAALLDSQAAEGPSEGARSPA